ncbi:N-terminal domain of NEFA-interacting nuclear protein NIP30-domain-containing protein [Collybia nuda]|uniref:N-terminal domain of NEFA-interacting nuclear protein NIP30-domain-containing protein n=1 Tax=Collybia nuda TaxID=64659 RepID=A0A9P5Y1Z8_9AGAR|nr:N-terminal domain of NEFA-interacting nuclear protein NIP30-domain-containing protein [Collybia nuda]
MEESMIPSLSTGAVGSRFVSQSDVDTAKARRDEQWKAAYARLGQEPPPQQQEDPYDGRSLAEKLAANKIAKQEEWEEKTKLANQFRALEEDEIMFLDSVREKQEEEERQRKEKDGEEVRNFKEAVAARSSAVNNLPSIGSNSTANPTSLTKVSSLPGKKDQKKVLKGVVVKRKAKAAPVIEIAVTKTNPTDTNDGQPDAKRRKVL